MLTRGALFGYSLRMSSRTAAESDACASLSAAISGRRSPLSWSVHDDHDEGTVTATGYREADRRPVHDQEAACDFCVTHAQAEHAAALIEAGEDVEEALLASSARAESEAA